MAILVILGIAVLSALAGLLALQCSSPPGGTRPIAYVPATGISPARGSAGAIRVGSLALSDALINGVFFAMFRAGPRDRRVGAGLARDPADRGLSRDAGADDSGHAGLLLRRLGAAAILRRAWLVGAGDVVLEPLPGRPT